MRASFENLLHITPSTFFEKLFFDREYNRGLYEKLGFSSYEVLNLERDPEGRIRRTVRAEPPLNVPGLLRRRLEGRVYYTETGVYDPRTLCWRFESVPSLKPEHVTLRGGIHLAPVPEGALHVCELELGVQAWGLGPLIERAIEANTRESYRITTEYTNRYAEEHGLLVKAQSEDASYTADHVPS